MDTTGSLTAESWDGLPSGNSIRINVGTSVGGGVTTDTNGMNGTVYVGP